jgi:hypothetical protein
VRAFRDGEKVGINGSMVSRLKSIFPLPRFNSSTGLPPLLQTPTDEWRRTGRWDVVVGHGMGGAVTQ